MQISYFGCQFLYHFLVIHFNTQIGQCQGCLKSSVLFIPLYIYMIRQLQEDISQGTKIIYTATPL